MNRREFGRDALGCVAAVIVSSRASAASEDSSVTTPTPGGVPPRLTGSFFDLAHPNAWDAAHWTDACRLWKEENWRALIQDMHGIGIDTAICTATAYWGRPVFGGCEKTVGRPLRFGCDDPLGVCVSEADRLGMKMFFGVGLRGRVSQVRDYAGMEPPWPDVWFQWNAALAGAIVERFGNCPSFAGLYIPYEMDFHDHEVELYEKFVRKHLRPVVGKVKILASPGNLGINRQRADLDRLPRLVERANIDILAPQDYGGRGSVAYARDVVAQQVEMLRKLRKPLADLGVTLWANCEVFSVESSPDGRSYCIAGPIDRIREQMQSQAPLVEKLICYQYQGIMNRHTEMVDIGHPGTERLYRDYAAYLTTLP